jgi:hypothetical protein
VAQPERIYRLDLFGQDCDINATGDSELAEVRPGTLAATWSQLMRVADDLCISDTDRNLLIERAEAVLGRLAETMTNTDAAIAAEILFRGWH